jgi:crotonobetainyl-CoA:carnitine CoA-transferase CaiB-like acyl-CoA transferase
MLPMVAPWLIEQSVSGQVTSRMGNRHPRFVPHNIYRCAGGEAFIHIAATSDAMWRGLAEAIGRPDLAALEADARRTREDEIDAAIEAWTQARQADAAMSGLQAAGVAAGVVRSPFDLAEDPHLKARGFWRMVDRPFCGPNIQSSLPFREEAGPYPVRHAAPTLGEFNNDVLGGILGLSAAELADLQAREIIGTEGLPPRQRRRG